MQSKFIDFIVIKFCFGGFESFQQYLSNIMTMSPRNHVPECSLHIPDQIETLKDFNFLFCYQKPGSDHISDLSNANLSIREVWVLICEKTKCY